MASLLLWCWWSLSGFPTERHFADVVLSEEFLNLGIEQVCSLISSDKLTISSEEKASETFSLPLRLSCFSFLSASIPLPSVVLASLLTSPSFWEVGASQNVWRTEDNLWSCPSTFSFWDRVCGWSASLQQAGLAGLSPRPPPSAEITEKCHHGQMFFPGSRGWEAGLDACEDTTDICPAQHFLSLFQLSHKCGPVWLEAPGTWRKCAWLLQQELNQVPLVEWVSFYS